MIKNYLLSSLRSLAKNRVYAIINILGLGIALAICIVAYYNYAFDANFNKIHENFDEIYQVNSIRDLEGRLQAYGIVPAPLGNEIKNDNPAVAGMSRIFNTTSPVKHNNELFSRRISYVDPGFFDIFTIPMVNGNSQTITEQNNILISEKFARTIFGDTEALGRSVIIINDDNRQFIYTISGVFEDFPENTSFRFDVLTHSDNFLSMFGVNDTDWGQWAHILFLQIPNQSSLESVLSSMNKFTEVQNKSREDFIISNFTLVPMSNVGDNSRVIYSNYLFPALHPAATISPPIMALMILLIACFNFANTTIAATGRRLKEIGVRKTFGGFRRQLIIQFLIESVLICFLAVLVSLAIAAFLVPAYGSLWEYMTLTLTLNGHWSFILFLFLLLMITGFLSGIYPALYISALKPLDILRGRTKLGKTGTLSNILLTLQFTISIMALVMGIVFLKNSEYQETIDLGYDRDKIIVVPLNPNNFNAFKSEIIDNPNIASVAGSQNHIGFGYYRRPLKDENNRYEVTVLDVGPEYPATIGLRLLSGRLFDINREGFDRAGSIIINEQFAEVFGWDDPINKTVTMYDTTSLTVIGMVEDYYYNGLWGTIEPTMIRLPDDDLYNFMVIKVKSNNLTAVQDYLREKWHNMFPSYIYSGMLQEETMREARLINDSILKINFFLAFVATILSLIGIYSMVSLNVLHRTREIGIRNVMGSPVLNTILLLSRKYMVVLAVASILGCAGGYYLSLGLLDSIWDYFLDITAWMLAISVIIMFIMTAITISGKTYRAATANPIKAIQTN